MIILCWAKPEAKAGLAEISATDATLYTPHPLNAEKYWLLLDNGKTGGSFSFKVDENTASVNYSDSTYTAKGDALSPSDGKYTVSFDSSGFTDAGNGEISKPGILLLPQEPEVYPVSVSTGAREAPAQ